MRVHCLLAYLKFRDTRLTRAYVPYMTQNSLDYTRVYFFSKCLNVKIREECIENLRKKVIHIFLRRKISNIYVMLSPEIQTCTRTDIGLSCPFFYHVTCNQIFRPGTFCTNTSFP